MAERQLTDRQRAFVEAIARGESQTEACRSAGIVETHSTTLLSYPHIQEAIQEATRAHIVAHASFGIKQLRHLAENAKSDRVRADCSRHISEIQGYIPPTLRNGHFGSERSLHEMTVEQLRAAADRLETELANRAKPIAGELIEAQSGDSPAE